MKFIALIKVLSSTADIMYMTTGRKGESIGIPAILKWTFMVKHCDLKTQCSHVAKVNDILT